MADRDAKRVERQLDRISAGLPSGVGGFLRWLRSPSSSANSGRTAVDHRRSCRLLAGIRILDGAAWRPAACAGHPLPPTAGTAVAGLAGTRMDQMEESEVTSTEGPGILNITPGRLDTRSRPMGRKSFWPQEQVPRGKKRAVQNPAETHLQTVSGDVRFGRILASEIGMSALPLKADTLSDSIDVR